MSLKIFFLSLFLFGLICIFPQEIFGENFNLIITGEQNPRIDSDYDYVVSVNGTLAEDRFLRIYLDDETKTLPLSEFKFSKYDEELKYFLKLDMSEYEWNFEKKYNLIAIIDTVTTQFALHPQSLEIAKNTSSAFNEPSVRIYGFIEKPMPERWLANIDLCAGTKRLTTPTVRITSDIDDSETQFNKIIAPDSCATIEGFDVVANDPNSIHIQYVGLDLINDKKNTNNYQIKTDTSLDTDLIIDEKNPENQKTTRIPDWVKNTMQWYLDGSISESEMISAIQFLVKEKIIDLN